MYKLILATIALSIFFNQASFASWNSIGHSNQLGGVDIFVDDQILKINKSYAQIKVLYNFSQVNYDRGISHLSEIEVVKFDCVRGRFSLVEVIWLNDSMGKGKKVWSTTNPSWQNLEANSAYDNAYKVGCQFK